MLSDVTHRLFSKPGLADAQLTGVAAWSRLQWCLVTLICLSCGVYTCGMAVADPDLWGHTLYGLRSLDQGVLTESHDPFSYTAPQSRWVNHEWLTEYQFGWLWKNAGEQGLWWWRNVLVMTVFAVGLAMFARAGGNLAACIVLFSYTAITLAGFCTFIRPQLATFALFSISLAILRSNWDRPTPLIWLMPLVMGIWVNMHGGFLAGIGLLGIFVVGSMARDTWDRNRPGETGILVRVAVLACAATLFNPYGSELHEMLWHHLTPKQAVREWQPLWGGWQTPGYYVPFAVAAIALLWSRRWQWIDLLVVAVVTTQAVSHIRHVALLAIAVLILFPPPLSDAVQRMFPLLGRRWSASSRAWPRVAAVVACVLLLAALHAGQTLKLWRGGLAPWQIAVECHGDSPGVPLAAISFMQEHRLQGNLVTSYGWGQYAIWQLFPTSKVAFDGRYRTVYPADLEDEFLSFLKLDERGPETTPMLDKYNTELALFPAKFSVCSYLRQRTDWVEVFSDKQSALFVKRDRFSGWQDQQLADVAAVPRWSRFPTGASPTSRIPASAKAPERKQQESAEGPATRKLTSSEAT